MALSLLLAHRVTGLLRPSILATKSRLTPSRQYLSSLSQELQTNAETPTSNWRTTKDQPLTRTNLCDLFRNRIASVRHRQFFTQEECQKLADVVRSHPMGSYNENVFPPIGAIGISQFDFQTDKEGYFKKVAEARSLHDRCINEAGVDVVSRVAELVEAATGIPVDVAKEGDQEYFAGLLRMINSSTLLHADYAPYDGPEWQIGGIVSQLTWNIMLTRVEGGETLIYDRLWTGKEDDQSFKKTKPSYGYSPLAVENCNFKVLQPAQGDLTIFNSRNFHEVKHVDRPKEVCRFTLSAFLGYLESETGYPSIIMWS